MKKIFKKINLIFLKFKDDYVSEYAAECAYFTILSFIPFFIFFLTLIQFTNINEETVIFSIKEVIPTSMHELIIGIIDEIYSKSVGTISIAVLLALWSSGKGFFSLCKGLRKIYNVKEEKSNFIMRIEGTIYTLIFVFAIILFLVIMVFGNTIHSIIEEKFTFLSNISFYVLKIRMIVFILAMFILFLMIYSFVPRHHYPIKYQIPGAIFASISWYVISFIFSIYIDTFQRFSNVYGSLSLIILIMMWVYVCMYTILIGAEINVINILKNTSSEKVNAIL